MVKVSRLGGILCDVRVLAPLLPASARSLRWKLADGHEPVEVLMTVEAHERGVGTFPQTPMDFRRMLVWWTRQFQTIWGTYLAAHDDAALDAFEPEYLHWINPTKLLDYPFALQAVDNSWWLVHSTDKSFLRLLEHDYRAERMPYDPH